MFLGTPRALFVLLAHQASVPNASQTTQKATLGFLRSLLGLATVGDSVEGPQGLQVIDGGVRASRLRRRLRDVQLPPSGR
eukprot:4909047-Alexandrium_andersonii.AAC.1